MLRFAVFRKDGPAENVDLAGAYLSGSDDVPLRAEITLKNGVISCEKRAAGPAGFCLLWSVPGIGAVLLETTRLPDRPSPYVLTVELARGRLTRLNSKLEDWGMLDLPEAQESIGHIEKARDFLIKALQADSQQEASAFGEKALVLAVTASEMLSRLHAQALLNRRKQSSGFGSRVFGCSVNLKQTNDAYRDRLVGGFDFVTLPVSWREIEPREQSFNWKPLDRWVETLTKKRLPIKGSALLSFAEHHIPDWLYIWEHDFETIRDLSFEHIRRVMTRYGQHIPTWDVVSGIHAQSAFTFNFEQLMELTRMATAAAKQTSSRCISVVNIAAPWGEYYARNQRTIPPLLYADMVIQSGLNFEAFGLELCFGPANDGNFTRDMFQLSAMLDQFGKLGKPLHITSAQVPANQAQASSGSGAGGGYWSGPWSEKVQAEWLSQFIELALSKPFVERICWGSLCDGDSSIIPSGGLLKQDCSPKAAHKALAEARASLIGSSTKRRQRRASR